ncbi:MAG TPA: VOC family protein [Armatimonadota bacterium]|jgi:hypothetical protein
MGRVVHFEIQGDDPQALADFYQNALGWEITIWNGPEPYWLVMTGPKEQPGINGGIMKRMSQQPVINTIGVESLDEAIAKVEANGGKVVSGPNEIPQVGTHAYCADPEGNLFGLLQPAPGSGM